MQNSALWKAESGRRWLNGAVQTRDAASATRIGKARRLQDSAGPDEAWRTQPWSSCMHLIPRVDLHRTNRVQNLSGALRIGVRAWYNSLQSLGEPSKALESKNSASYSGSSQGPPRPWSSVASCLPGVSHTASTWRHAQAEQFGAFLRPLAVIKCADTPACFGPPNFRIQTCLRSSRSASQPMLYGNGRRSHASPCRV